MALHPGEGEGPLECEVDIESNGMLEFGLGTNDASEGGAKGAAPSRRQRKRLNQEQRRVGQIGDALEARVQFRTEQRSKRAQELATALRGRAAGAVEGAKLRLRAAADELRQAEEYFEDAMWRLACRHG